MTSHRQRGGAALKFVLGFVSLPFVVALCWYVYASIRLSYWNNEVRELCAKDGGVTVYQKVQLLPGEAIPSLPNEAYASRESPYVTRVKEEIIRARNPEVVRREVLILKREGGVTLGRWVVFSRIGGDTGFVDHRSSFSCQDIKRDLVEQQIFISTGATK
jgi:hypothetical protein